MLLLWSDWTLYWTLYCTTTPVVAQVYSQQWWIRVEAGGRGHVVRHVETADTRSAMHDGLVDLAWAQGGYHVALSPRANGCAPHCTIYRPTCRCALTVVDACRVTTTEEHGSYCTHLLLRRTSLSLYVSYDG